jgi:hypothetical protein
VADVATGGIDNRATIFYVELIPTGDTPPSAAGAGHVPLDSAAVASDSVERFGRTIQFDGLTWGIKEAPVGVDPGGNHFSYDPNDVFVDGAGLHLTVHYHDGIWWSTEVVLLDQLGHGTYSFQTNSNVNTLDPNVTFGAFTWDPYGDDVSGASPNREIDFEDSRWGNASDPTNAQMVVQPYTVSGNLHRYTIPDQGTNPALTRFFRWEQNHIQFVALTGHQSPSNYPPQSVIDQFLYLHDPSIGHYVPTVGRENFRFNLWLNSGASAPSNGQSAQVVITNFTFIPPIIVTPDSATTNENTAVTVSVLANDSDSDGDTLSVTAVTQGAHGSVVNNGTTVNYTPNTNFHGTDSFTYTASDGVGNQASATVTITVVDNSTVTANNDSVTTNENTPVTVSVLANDSDSDGDTLSVTAVTQGTHGSVVNNGTTVNYTPNTNFHGTDSFRYTASDAAGNQASATGTITVVDNSTVTANNDSVTTNKNTPVTISVLANDSDSDGDTLSVTAITQGAHGSLVNNGTTVTYTPNADFHGTDSFTYTASDAAGNQATGTVFVLITLVPPVDIAGRVSSSGEWWVGLSTGSSFTNSKWTNWNPNVTWVDVQTGDFTGDGHQDIVGRVLQSGEWWVAVSNGSNGFTNSKWDSWNPNVTWVDVKVGDFNGDGKMDITGRVLQSGEWWVGLSTGSSFTTSKWAAWSTAVTWADVQVGDFDGNGKADIAGRALQSGEWWVGLSSGSSFTASKWATWSPAVTWVDVRVGDFNGDGKADITGRVLQSGEWWTGLSNGSIFNTTRWAIWNPNVTWVDVRVGDFDGNGKSDIMGRVLQSGEWWTGLSTGSSFNTTLWDTWSPNVTWVDVQVGDFNGDGKADITGRVLESGEWWTALSSGSSFSTGRWTIWSNSVTWANVHAGDFA